MKKNYNPKRIRRPKGSPAGKKFVRPWVRATKKTI